MTIRRNTAGANYLRNLNHVLSHRRPLTPFEWGVYQEALDLVRSGRLSIDAACEFVKNELGKEVA